jgi:hypothetical protein
MMLLKAMWACRRTSIGHSHPCLKTCGLTDQNKPVSLTSLRAEDQLQVASYRVQGGLSSPAPKQHRNDHNPNHKNLNPTGQQGPTMSIH